MATRDFVAPLARCETSCGPLTLQEVVRVRIELDSQELANAGDIALPPEVAWRSAWLRHRQVLLIPSLVAEDRVIELCNRYAQYLRRYAHEMSTLTVSSATASGLVRPLLAATRDFWLALDDRLQELGAPPLHWLDEDAAQIAWIRLCSLYLATCFTAEGRRRSRREIASVLASSGLSPASANSIRLRILPRLERDMEVADAWSEQSTRLCRRPPENVPATETPTIRRGVPTIA